jgi:hypothetical protein
MESGHGVCAEAFSTIRASKVKYIDHADNVFAEQQGQGNRIATTLFECAQMIVLLLVDDRDLQSPYLSPAGNHRAHLRGSDLISLLHFCLTRALGQRFRSVGPSLCTEEAGARRFSRHTAGRCIDCDQTRASKISTLGAMARLWTAVQEDKMVVAL